MLIYFLVNTGRTVHDDIGNIKYISKLQRSILGIITSRVSDSVIYTTANSRIQCKISPGFLKHRHDITIHLRFLIIHFNISTVRSTQGSSGRRIEFLTQLVSPVIHVATSLNRQPIIYPKVCRKGKDNARTRFFTLYTVHYPIWILFEVFGKCMPVLHIQIPFFVIGFKMVFIIRQILTTRKTIKPYQRIHIKASRYRLILNSLFHYIHITIQLQTFVEHGSRFA